MTIAMRLDRTHKECRKWIDLERDVKLQLNRDHGEHFRDDRLRGADKDDSPLKCDMNAAFEVVVNGRAHVACVRGSDLTVLPLMFKKPDGAASEEVEQTIDEVARQLRHKPELVEAVKQAAKMGERCER